jgi:hypothetical protein
VTAYVNVQNALNPPLSGQPRITRILADFSFVLSAFIREIRG